MKEKRRKGRGKGWKRRIKEGKYEEHGLRLRENGKNKVFSILISKMPSNFHIFPHNDIILREKYGNLLKYTQKNSPCTARKESAGKNIGFEGGMRKMNIFFGKYIFFWVFGQWWAKIDFNYKRSYSIVGQTDIFATCFSYSLLVEEYHFSTRRSKNKIF